VLRRPVCEQMGIVGLPNVGKSSTFNLMTKCSIPAENFPFCTIDPNNARVNVPDSRFNWLVDTYKPKSQVPAFLEVRRSIPIAERVFFRHTSGT
jgi:obg-like ATPase 1